MLNLELESYKIDYTTSKNERILNIKKFRTSLKIQILINVQILNEGIDIPECDSIFITSYISNTINLIQRMCRCNRIIKNKLTSNIYIWNNSDKIYINNVFKNMNLIIKSEILSFNNYIKNIIFDKNHDIKEFLKCDKFIIDLEKVSKLLNNRKETIKNTLINSYIDKIDYSISKNNNIKIGRPNELIMITPKCFNKLCFNSKNKKANEIKNMYIENNDNYLQIIKELII